MPRAPRTRLPSEVFDSLRFVLRGVEELEIPIADRTKLSENLRKGLAVLLPYYGGDSSTANERKPRARAAKRTG